MKKSVVVLSLVLAMVLTAGCDGLRFAPNQAQKQNAWLHGRTAAMTAETARAEGASDKLQSLARLSDIQAGAVTAYFGQPAEFPAAATAEEILSQSNAVIANQAAVDAVRRPDVWQITDGAIELGIGICALLGGVYGTRAAGFLRDAKTKSMALKEIIQGNELFKQLHAESAGDFKAAQGGQSPQTRQIVAAMKA